MKCARKVKKNNWSFGMMYNPIPRPWREVIIFLKYFPLVSPFYFKTLYIVQNQLRFTLEGHQVLL